MAKQFDHLTNVITKLLNHERKDRHPIISIYTYLDIVSTIQSTYNVMESSAKRKANIILTHENLNRLFWSNKGIMLVSHIGELNVKGQSIVETGGPVIEAFTQQYRDRLMNPKANVPLYLYAMRYYQLSDANSDVDDSLYYGMVDRTSEAIH